MIWYKHYSFNFSSTYLEVGKTKYARGPRCHLTTSQRININTTITHELDIKLNKKSIIIFSWSPPWCLFFSIINSDRGKRSKLTYIKRTNFITHTCKLVEELKQDRIWVHNYLSDYILIIINSEEGKNFLF